MSEVAGRAETVKGRKLEIKKILVPVDFSKHSLRAIDYAVFIAGRVGAEILLLHVVEGYEYQAEADQRTITDIIVKGAEQKLQDIARKYEEKTRIACQVRKGRVYRVVDQVCDEAGIDLVVMSTKGASSLLSSPSKFFMGSNAYRVVTSVNPPVLSIRNPDRLPAFERIVLPLDITKETTQKVDLAIQWAKWFGSKIYVVSVLSFWQEYFYDAFKLEKDLEDTVRKINEAGVEVEAHSLRYGDIADSVMGFARDVNADLIIIMTRQERKWSEPIVGSTARTIIERSDIPVLSVHPHKPE